MAKNEKTQSQEFQRRPGADPFGDAKWRGINTEKDPGSLAPNELQWGENIRLRGSGFGNRGGLSLKINLNDYSDRADVGDVNWMGSDPSGAGATALYLAALGCSSPATFGFQIFVYDQTQSPSFYTYIDSRATADRFAPIGRYGDRLFLGDSYLLKEILLLTGPYGINPATQLGANANPIEQREVFTGYTIRAFKEHEGLFYISQENDAAIGNSRIIVYDGSQYREDLTGIRPALCFGIWQNKLVAGFDATAGHIRVRTSGSAVPGTWNTFALGGFSCSVSQNAMQEVRDKLWIASGGTGLYSFDGAALALGATVAGADATGDGVTSLALHDGLLHYGWNEAVTFNARIGRHDPDSTATEFLDTYKDVTAGAANFKRLVSLASFRRRLYMGGQGGTADWLASTADNDVKGAITINSTGIATAGFRLRQILLHGMI